MSTIFMLIFVTYSSAGTSIDGPYRTELDCHKKAMDYIAKMTGEHEVSFHCMETPDKGSIYELKYLETLGIKQ